MCSPPPPPPRSTPDHRHIRRIERPARPGRLIEPVEANELFVILSEPEKTALRSMGFDFYDWPAPQDAPGAARLVTAWNADPVHVAALARAIGNL